MNILIVDDRPLFRDGLAALLHQGADQTTVVQAASIDESLLHLDGRSFDAVFLNLRLPGLSGETAIQVIRRLQPALPILVLSSSESPHDVRRALQAGASGYLPESATAQAVAAALRVVLSGQVYVPPLLVTATRPVDAAQGRRALSQLTERQVDVLHYLRDGLTNQEIGASLGIAEKTVKVHIAAIFKTLNVSNRSQATGFLTQL